MAEFYADTRVKIWSAAGDSREVLLTAPKTVGNCTVTAEGDNLWRLDLTYPESDTEPMLTVDYLGDRAEIYDARKSGKLIADWFTTGLPLKLSLEQYRKPRTLLVKVFPSEENRYFDLPVEPGCAVRGAKMTFRHRKSIGRD